MRDKKNKFLVSSEAFLGFSKILANNTKNVNNFTIDLLDLEIKSFF